MRVIQVITMGSDLYGAQRHVLDLCTWLNSEGHEVLLLVGSVGKLTDELGSLGVRYIEIKNLKRRINPFNDFLVCIKLILLIRKFRPDLVASHSSKAGILTRLASFICGVPNVFTAHGWSFADGVDKYSSYFYLQIERLMGCISNKVICVSESDRDLAIKKKVAHISKLELVYNGVRDLYKVHLNNKHIIRQKSFIRIIMVAGFRPQKDYETLVLALAEIKDLPWEAYFIGDGVLIDETKDFVEKFKLTKRIVFTGAIDNVEDYLESADIMVLSTNWEGLPLSIIEGMAYYLPIVASDLDGIKEQVENEVNGFIFYRRNFVDLSLALKRLILDENLRVTMGKNSRKRYLSKFTLDTMCENTFKVYSNLILNK